MRVLSCRFRNLFLIYLRKAFKTGKLRFHGELAELASQPAFEALCLAAKQSKWVVFAKPPFGGPEQVLKYLARYTHRVAISNRRLLSIEDDRVSFEYKDYADGNQTKVMTLAATADNNAPIASARYNSFFMKPRIFIGSSERAAVYAGAIHDFLMKDGECTTWTEGGFYLSRSTTDGLIKNLRDSDFGTFVFAADDTAEIKGSLLNITRDNVVYEAGLFAGYLSPQRCFIVIPASIDIRIPSDLLGMTVGHYEDDRSDKNWISAVATFCRQVQGQISAMGFFAGHPHEQLRELSVKFDCCEWIPDDPDPKNKAGTRLARKRQVLAEINAFCKIHPVNKFRLLQHRRLGDYIALLIAIKQRPENGDERLIMQFDTSKLTPGTAYGVLVDAVEVLKSTGCTGTRLIETVTWLKSLPWSSGVASRIARL